MEKVSTSLAAMALSSGAAEAASESSASLPTVVLVHGAFVDGAGWYGVYRLLRAKGYPVVVVQNPTTSLADDVAATLRAIAIAKGDVVLVGHSYGGVVITEAGVDPKVRALVYIAAFAPDAGESVASLNAGAPPGAGPPLLPPSDGFLRIDAERFPQAFAADLSSEVAAFMADAQVPWALEALEGVITTPAWRSKPSWTLIPRDDRMIPPDAQRAMAGRAGAKVREVAGSHAVYVSNPAAVVEFIVAAAAR